MMETSIISWPSLASLQFIIFILNKLLIYALCMSIPPLFLKYKIILTF